MLFCDSEAYNVDYTFTDQQLLGIQLEEIAEWMCLKAFGIPNPGPNDNPMQGCSSSLAQYKKAISFFMPNEIATWNSLAKVGNPTRSKNVNELIRCIKKQECCKQGKSSQAQHDVAPAEYKQVIELTEADVNQPNHYLYSAFF